MNTLTADRVVIRDAEPRDLEAIRGLLRVLRDATGSDSRLDRRSMASLFQAMQADPGHYRNLVACEHGKVIGFVSSVSYLGLMHGGGNGSAFINDLVVAETHRNRGIGADLVRTLVRRCRGDKREALEVGTRRTNKGAIRFYRRAGFRLEYRLLGMDLDGPER